MTLNRRRLLFSAAAGIASRLAGADRANRADQSRMIVRSPKPEDLEMPLDGFVDWITPVERFFVRCHSYTPEVNLAGWKLTVEGQVTRPLTLTMEEIRKLPRYELVSVLECAGNGRSFYEPHMPGAQWAFGGVGNGRWAGARLRDVLKMAGLKDSGVEVLFDGADVPLGKMPDFQRTIPVKKALDQDTLLAYEMNGRPLGAEHGFPLRVIAPGWAGDSWVKWLERIEVLDHEFEGFWMKTAYRHPTHPVEPGTAVDPKDMTPVTDLNVKSLIAAPGGWAKPGPVRVSGTAWSNANPVTKVEVSTDGGAEWRPARLGRETSQYGWRLWWYDWKPAAGDYTLLSRATNSAGATQPLMQEWNPSGYLWSVAQARKITVSRERPKPDDTPDGGDATYPPGYQAACMTCHDEHLMRQQHLTRAQWEKETTKMVNWGAAVKPEQREGILDYLAGRFK